MPLLLARRVPGMTHTSTLRLKAAVPPGSKAGAVISTLFIPRT